MKLRYITEKLNPNGTKERSQQEFDKTEVVIGRGGTSDIIFQNRLISLTHAKLYVSDGKLAVEDLGSIGGLRVNGRLVQKAELKAGDELKLGDIRLTVVKDEQGFGLNRVVEEEKKEKTEEIIRRHKDALDIRSYFPSFKFLSLALSIGVAVVFWLVPLLSDDPTRPDKLLWNSGPISNGHKMIERDCERCHQVPFQQVQDTTCESCHKMTDHAEALPKLIAAQSKDPEAHDPRAGRRCAECHMEHNGDVGKHPMSATESKLCASCHANITGLKSDTAHPNIDTWASHPEFAVSVRASWNDPNAMRVKLSDKTRLKDSTPLKLNHALHLEKNIRGANGPETLNCRSCHELSSDFKSILPISMEKHCLSCHPLGFDSRLPAKRVPHGNADEIYPYLYTEYTMLLLAGAEPEVEEEIDPATLRQKPGGTGLQPPRREVINTSSVTREARSAETQLFTKTACVLCHETALKPEQVRTESNGHYDVAKPNVPDRWLPGSIFSHGAHEEVSCESCHSGTRQSKSTTDVLLPGVDSCRGCHTDGGGGGTVKSECVLCHSYHDPVAMPVESKNTIENLVAHVR